MELLDLFRPKWKNSNRDIRKASIKNIKNKSTLETIFNNDKENEIKNTALKQLLNLSIENKTDITLIVRLIKLCFDGEVIQMFGELCASISQQSTRMSLREACLQALFDVSHWHHDYQVLRDILDTVVLDISQNDSDLNFRKFAIGYMGIDIVGDFIDKTVDEKLKVFSANKLDQKMKYVEYDQLTKYIKNKNSHICISALRALEKAISNRFDYLEDQDPKSNKYLHANEEIWKIYHMYTTMIYSMMKTHPDNSVRVVIGKILKKLLVPLLKKNDLPDAFNIFKDIWGQKAVEDLLNSMAADKNHFVRENAAALRRYIISNQSADHLIKIINDYYDTPVSQGDDFPVPNAIKSLGNFKINIQIIKSFEKVLKNLDARFDSITYILSEVIVNSGDPGLIKKAAQKGIIVGNIEKDRLIISLVKAYTTNINLRHVWENKINEIEKFQDRKCLEIIKKRLTHYNLGPNKLCVMDAKDFSELKRNM